MDPADHVRIASITKTFVATAILQLVDQGKLNLDDKLAAYVDESRMAKKSPSASYSA